MATRKVGGPSRGGTSPVGGTGGGKSKKGDETRKVEGIDFTQSLASATEKQEIQAELHELLNKLKAQGEKLANTPTYPEMISYRALVREFLDQIVKRVYKVEELNSLRFSENGKVFLVAQRVDQQLEAMAEEILKGQAQPLSILKRADEIRGLLFDLLG